MRFALVVALVRLYPSCWRAEYGDEFALVLVRRPLSPSAILNVIAGAIRQHVRIQPPWRIVAALLLLWMAIDLALAFTSLGRLAAPPTVGIAIFLSVGFWTAWRSGTGGGKAALKLSIVLSVPRILVACVYALWVSLAARSESKGVDLSFGPLLYLPYAPLFGWIGGRAGTLLRRRLRSAH